VAEGIRGDGEAVPFSTVRFGRFKLDLRAAELRKGATRMRLQNQPYQILRMLLGHPGEVVLREEIRERLWPNDTVVEFDHCINRAVRRLRNALSESADKPRYIETLPRRGYRFIGKVESEFKQGAAAPTVVMRPECMQLTIHIPDDMLEAVKNKLPAPQMGVLEAVALHAVLGFLMRLAESNSPPEIGS